MRNEALIVLKSHTLEQARGAGDLVPGVVVYLSSLMVKCLEID